MSQTLHLLLSPPFHLLPILLLLPPSSHPCPACQIASDSIQQRLSGAIKKVPKHSVKCRLLTKMRLDQDQYSLPLLPNTRAHPSTNTITDEPQNQLRYTRPDSLAIASSLSYSGRTDFTKALLLKDWDAAQRWFTDLLWDGAGFCGWISLTEKFLFCLTIDSPQTQKGPISVDTAVTRCIYSGVFLYYSSDWFHDGKKICFIAPSWVIYNNNYVIICSSGRRS